MKLLAVLTVFLIATTQPLTAQKLGMFLNEYEKELKQAEHKILNNCKIPINLDDLLRKKNTTALTKLARNWIHDCRQKLILKGVNNKTTDFFLNMAESLTPTIKNLTNRDFTRYSNALTNYCQKNKPNCPNS
jgi:hypothetical protein